MMAKEYAVLLVSHAEPIADGLKALISQVARDVTILAAGGDEEGGIGTSFEKISHVLEKIEEKNVLAFYDLGSAKMNLELVMELSDKVLWIEDTAFIEGAYTAASLLQADASIDAIKAQLEPLIIK